jgi:hypothetical protein
VQTHHLHHGWDKLISAKPNLMAGDQLHVDQDGEPITWASIAQAPCEGSGAFEGAWEEAAHLSAPGNTRAVLSKGENSLPRSSKRSPAEVARILESVPDNALPSRRVAGVGRLGLAPDAEVRGGTVSSPVRHRRRPLNPPPFLFSPPSIYVCTCSILRARAPPTTHLPRHPPPIYHPPPTAMARR